MATSVVNPLAGMRKPPAKAFANTVVVGGKPVILADTVMRMVAELWANQDPREFSRVIARRLGVNQLMVGHIMAGLLMENERVAATLMEAVRNAMPLAKEAAGSVWEDVA